MTGYLALGACLTLAVFFVASTAAVVLMRVAWALASHRLESRPPRARAAWFFAFRTSPTVVGLVAGVLMVAPAYVAFEPRGTGEAVAISLGALALAGGASLSAGVLRVWAENRRTGRIVRCWLSGARPLQLGALQVPAFQIRSAGPFVVLAGWRRPKVLVSRRVLDCCSAEELAAIVAHETAHLVARDNLKRIALAACADLLCWTRWSRQLEERWLDASEEAADDRAVATGGDPTELAGALVKVARLAAVGEPELVASAICRGERVARRVRRLLNDASPPVSPCLAWARVGGAMALAAGITLGLAGGTTWRHVHGLLELVVAVLP